MRAFFRAAIAALSIASISPALAGEGEGTITNTQFTELPGVVAQGPAAADPWRAAVAQDRGSANTFTTQSNHVVSLFPVYDHNDGGGN
jgi:hypothetical protein